MNVERMIAYYDINGHWLGPPVRTEDVARLLAGCPTVLDVGSGDGRLLDMLQGFGWTVQMTGVDCVPAHVAASRSRHPAAEWILDDFMRVDFAGRTFHGVSACQLFTADGWEPADIQPAIRKLVSLATLRVVIYNNGAFTDAIRQAVEPFAPRESLSTSGSESTCFIIDAEALCTQPTA